MAAAIVLVVVAMQTVVVGRSSRAEVFAALGRPSRTERSASGEAWIYEAKTGDPTTQGLMSGASAASGVAGAFIPYAGLVGSGLGLAITAMGKARPAVVVSLAVAFGADGVVRDCIYSSTAFPIGEPGTETGSTVVDCRRTPIDASRVP